MPIDTIDSSGVWDKFIVNLGFGPKLSIIELYPKIEGNTLEFYSPILVDNDGNSVKGDGYHLYIETIMASDHKNITTPLSKVKNNDNKLVISEVKFMIDIADPILHFYFKIEKGFIDGRFQTIENVDDIGVYYLSSEKHKHFDWWDDFKMEGSRYRVASFYDVQFLGCNFSTVEKEIKTLF